VSQVLASIDNREIAITAWIAIALCWCLLKPIIREGLVDVIRAATARQIVIIVSLAVAYMAFVTSIFYAIGAWSIGQLNLSLLWLLFAGLPSLANIPKISENPRAWRASVTKNFKLSIFFDFFINFFALPLFAEFLLVPFMAILGGMLVYSEREEKYKSVHKLINGILATTVFGLLAFSTYHAIANFESFATLNTSLALLLPVAYNVMFIPFLWSVTIYSAYEEVFCRLQFVIKDTKLLRYTRRKLIFSFGANVSKLNAWFEAAWSHTITSQSDIVKSISVYARPRDVA
jgi:hypothetical protein